MNRKDYTSDSFWDDHKSIISCDRKYPGAQVQILRRSKASLRSVSQVDFIDVHQIVWGFALAHYFNSLFKYTQTADFCRCLLIKYGVPPSLLLLQALIVWLCYGTFKGRANFFSERGYTWYSRRFQSKLLYCW